LQGGAEEFALILPETALPGTLIVAGLAIPHAHSKAADHVTVSLGAVSTRCRLSADPSEILTLADRQLDAAKAAGRNRVEVA